MTRIPMDTEANILRMAALFHQDFSIDWLITLSGSKASTILEILEEAIGKGLLVKKDFSRYCFQEPERKEAFVQGLSPEETRDLKGRIVRLLLEELPDNEEKARRVSGYLLDIPNNLEQCRWLAAAGEVFSGSYKHQKAFACYLKALGDLEEIQAPEAESLFIETVLKYSRIADFQFDIRKTSNLLNKALKMAGNHQDLRSQALLQMHMAKNEWYRSNYAEAEDLFQKGWAISETMADPRLRRSALTFSTFFHYWQGYFQEAVNIYESEVISPEENTPGRFPFMAECTMGNCYNFIGQAAQGFGIIDAVRSRSKLAGDTFMEGFSGIVMAISLMNIQRFGEAMEHLEAARREARKWPKSPLSMILNLITAYGHFQGGDIARTGRHLKKFLALREQIQVSMWPYPYLLELCWAMEEDRLPPIAGLFLDKEIRLAKQGKNVFMEGIACRFEALAMQKTNAPPQTVHDALLASEQFLAKSGHLMELFRTRLLMANHHLSQGRDKEAAAIRGDLSQALSSIPVSMIPADLLPLRMECSGRENLARDLSQVAANVSKIRDSETLAHHLITTSSRMIGAERGAVFLFHGPPGNRALSLYASRNLGPEQVAEPGFQPALDAIKTAARTGEGVILSQTQMPDSGSDKPIRSLLCAPLVLEGRVLGVLYHDNRMLLDLFRDSHLKQMRYFTAILALVLGLGQAKEELQAIKEGALEIQPPRKHRSHGMVGQSQPLERVLAHVRQVAATEATVLILGETGVGKELVAKAIHEASGRSQGPFISVNCNALPDSLISSELFGHEKGSFTGAINRRMGRFELATGGTLFLDEIGELPMETQVKLLRVLQTREFERIGGAQTLRSDFRLIAATNRNLESRVEEGLFRADLFYRLNVFPIPVPSLRHRKEDIPLLARHFLQVFSLRTGKRFTSFPEYEMEKLMRHDWPGNVRELENVMERGAILSRSSIFQVPELDKDPEFSSLVPATPGMSLREVERNHILQTLESTRGKIRGPGGASELLDIHPSTLYSRMKKLGISPGGQVSVSE
ncbi:MAG: sigma 54-interacting transcriptional regulator [Desulfatibacillum sp.]|nr:sigma 54-interacting transcriptional regulator [Desulfatibacillum sp.]